MNEFENYNTNTSGQSEPLTATPTVTPVQPAPQTPPTQNINASPVVVPIKPKKKPVFFSKLLGAVAIGLTFGVCAAFGIFAVNEVLPESLFGTKNNAQIEELQSQIDELKSSVSKNTAITPQASGAVQTTTQTLSSVTTDVTAVVDKVMPSMVSITNIYEETTSYWGRTYTSEQQASGSGIIIGENDKEYLIVTNYHVIEKCVQLTVQFADSETAGANVKGYDESMDIAVISVQKDSVPATTKKVIAIAEIGDSDSLKIGEPAIAIGNALGYGQSVTTGVISALDRNLEMENSYDALIQTSAAINPGNSGGALLNIAGQVIGINSSKIGGSTIEGMGYAIPVNAIKELVEEFSNRETLYKVDENERGYLGISGATVDSTTSETYGIPSGVYVTSVYSNSAAEAAGIIEGDVITKVNGQSVSTIKELQDLLAYYKGGDEIKVIIERAALGGYSEMEVMVTLSSKNVFDAE